MLVAVSVFEVTSGRRPYFDVVSYITCRGVVHRPTSRCRTFTHHKLCSVCLASYGLTPDDIISSEITKLISRGYEDPSQ